MKIAFDKKVLPSEVLEILKKDTNVYTQAAALNTLISTQDSPAMHTLLCLAHLELACANTTGFEEDIIDFGGRAVEALKQALTLEPGNSTIIKSIDTLQKKIKKAEKEAHSILEYEKENLDEMPGIDYVNELAFYYYSRISRNKAFAAKGYKCYKYLYENQLQKDATSPELLYYLNASATCRFVAEGYEASSQEIEKLIQWDITLPQYRIYRESVTNAYWMKLYHYSQTNDFPLFEQLYHEWYTKMIPLENGENIQLAIDLKTLNTISLWLLSKENAPPYLEYILENGYLFLHKSVLGEEERAIIGQISHRLNK